MVEYRGTAEVIQAPLSAPPEYCYSTPASYRNAAVRKSIGGVYLLVRQGIFSDLRRRLSVIFQCRENLRAAIVKQGEIHRIVVLAEGGYYRVLTVHVTRHVLGNHLGSVCSVLIEIMYGSPGHEQRFRIEFTYCQIYSLVVLDINSGDRIAVAEYSRLQTLFKQAFSCGVDTYKILICAAVADIVYIAGTVKRIGAAYLFFRCSAETKSEIGGAYQQRCPSRAIY